MSSSPTSSSSSEPPPGPGVLLAMADVICGVDFVIGEKEEVRFDIVYSAVPEGARRAFTVLTGLVLIVLYAVSLPAAWKFVSFMKVERSAYLHIPLNYLYSIYPIFAVACIGRYCALVWRAVRGESSPETDAAALTD